jgi:hypothetical protein
MGATEPFVSHAPRPYRRPFLRCGMNFVPSAPTVSRCGASLMVRRILFCGTRRAMRLKRAKPRSLGWWGRASSRAVVVVRKDRLAGSLAPPFEINLLEFHFQSYARGDSGEKIRDALLACERMWLVGLSRRSSVRRNEGGIHAGQRDEFGQKFFRARHGRRMSQPKALCHFLLDMGVFRAQT